MKQSWSKYMIISVVLFAIVSVSSFAAADNGGASKACLKCHGPFDKLLNAPPSFVAKSGEKVRPHMYVPHDLKEIPDCGSCHKPHSLPPDKNEIAKLPKPNVDTCFSCHHTENFTPCKSCHGQNK